MPSKEPTRDGKKVISEAVLKRTAAGSPAGLIHQTQLTSIVQRARRLPGSVTASDILKLQQAIGNKATGKLLVSGIQTSANNKIIQRTPDFHLNQETHRYFQITLKPGEIQADQTDMSAMESTPPLHYGYLKYDENPKKKTMVLKTLVAEPEEGSGLGVLLMYLMGHLAAQKGYKIIEVTNPAKDKLTYYAKFGFDIEERQAELKKKYLDMKVAEEEIPNPIAVGFAMTTPAKLTSTTATSLNKRWKAITLPPRGRAIRL